MQQIKIAIIGLGYVGLPLACLFAAKYPVIGYDINTKRINELNSGVDVTQEIDSSELQKVILSNNTFKTTKRGLYCTNNSEELKEANIYIITVPTPVDKNNRPDLTPLQKASKTVGHLLKKDDIVIYESTVYPGVTEDECIPILETFSNLTFNTDFFVGYSPERINPGDKQRTLDKIKKITSGSTPEIGIKINQLYQSIITAGTHLVSSIKIAEAAKVIENSQRDINIAFVNELAKIFALLEIDTQEVLEAAATKWNFIPFKPGLVGGHCIGVDPFYLAQKAQEIGYYSELILASRRLNDSMPSFISSQIVKTMIHNDLKIKGANVLNLGITFKENCPDIRNSKAIELIYNLKDYGIQVTNYDPWLDSEIIKKEYNINSLDPLFFNNELKEDQKFDAIILTVAHEVFLKTNWKTYLKSDGVIYDVKGVLPKENIHKRL